MVYIKSGWGKNTIGYINLNFVKKYLVIFIGNSLLLKGDNIIYKI